VRRLAVQGTSEGPVAGEAITVSYSGHARKAGLAVCE
jgi:hypothetical protein